MWFKIKIILLIAFIGLFSVSSFAQTTPLADSIVQSVQQEKNYDQKIAILQKSIKEIYNTKSD